MPKNYETEVRERYGNTAAYREHEQKTKKRLLNVINNIEIVSACSIESSDFNRDR